MLDDVRIVALTIENEAGGEGVKGMRAVGNVIENRMRQRRLTAAQVCKQPHQFSCWNRTHMREPSQVALMLARSIVMGVPLPKETDANHFYSGKKVPYWAAGQKKTVIGNHTFVTIPTKTN